MECEGDLAEIGVGRGAARSSCARSSRPTRSPRRASSPSIASSAPIRPAKTREIPAILGRFRADLHQVSLGFERFGLLDERVRLLQGDPEALVRDAPFDRLALVRVGPGLGAALGPVLDAVHERLQPGAR